VAHYEEARSTPREREAAAGDSSASGRQVCVQNFTYELVLSVGESWTASGRPAFAPRLLSDAISKTSSSSRSKVPIIPDELSRGRNGEGEDDR